MKTGWPRGGPIWGCKHETLHGYQTPVARITWRINTRANPGTGPQASDLFGHRWLAKIDPRQIQKIRPQKKPGIADLSPQQVHNPVERLHKRGRFPLGLPLINY